MTAIVPNDTTTASFVMVCRTAHKAWSLCISSPGSLCSVRPNNSRSWLAKTITAIPAVNPTVTGNGMYLMNVPNRRNPATSSTRPDRKVARIKPSTPCRVTVAATSTMNAPAGPPTWNRLPPRAEMMKPPTIAVYSPRSGDTPEAMAIAIDSGKATIATVSPAIMSDRRCPSP